jgi:hypothetical protein
MRFVTAEARQHVVRAAFAAVVYVYVYVLMLTSLAILFLQPSLYRHHGAPRDLNCADDDDEVLACCYLRRCRLVSVAMQARIAEYFGVTEALIAARGAQNRINRSEEEEKDEDNLLQAMKKKADESHAE